MIPVKREPIVRNLKALLLSSAIAIALDLSSYVIAVPNLSPSITSFSPSTGSIGTTVTINGENLEAVMEVTFNGVGASFNLFGSQLTATVPQGATTGPIRVVSPNGLATSGADFIVTASLPPNILGFDPLTGPPGTQVTIAGDNLGGATDVKFNGVSAGFGTDLSGMNLIATVPAGATTGPINVVTPTGTDTSSGSFTVTALPLPLINNFTPNSGPIGTRVTINGTNLTGVTSVRFNGVNAEFTVGFFGASITASVPLGATTGLITLEHPAGPGVSADVFTVTGAPQPTIDSFAPNYGQEGDRVTITGANLTDATSVRFSGREAGFNVFGNSVFALVPGGGGATGPITVVTAAGSATSADNFFIGTFPDLVVTIASSAEEVALGQDLTYTITISNQGLADANNVTLTDTLPNGLDLVIVLSNRGTCLDQNDTVNCEFGTLAKGTSAVVKVIATATAGPSINNQARVSTTDFEPSTGDNSASLVTPVNDQEPPVSLSISVQSQNTVEISWPAASTGYSLESAGSLLPPINWTPTTNDVQIIGSRATVTAPLTPEPTFFRLNKP